MHPKTLKYTPVQKLEMFLVALLAGAKAVSQTNLTLGVDAAHSPSLWLARLCRSVGDCRHPQCRSPSRCDGPPGRVGRPLSALQPGAPPGSDQDAARPRWR